MGPRCTLEMTRILRIFEKFFIFLASVHTSFLKFCERNLLYDGKKLNDYEEAVTTIKTLVESDQRVLSTKWLITSSIIQEMLSQSAGSQWNGQFEKAA